MGSLFIVSAPSGAGKSSLVKAICNQDSQIKNSISYTTRNKRNNEVEAQDYFFIDLVTFQSMQQNNQFLESAQVYDNWYATSAIDTQNLRKQGFDVILEIDHQGASNIKHILPEAISIYIMPPSLDALATRLTARNTEDPADLNKRLALAMNDASHASKYDYIVINDNFHQAIDDLYSIIQVTRLKSEKVLTKFKLR